MDHKGTVTLETERLQLRCFTEEDAESMYRNWASDPEVTKYLTWPPHADVNVTRQLLSSWSRRYEEKTYYNWAIVLKESGEPVGNISVLKLNDRTEAAYVVYCMGRQWWGREIMPEALYRVIAFLFCEVGVNRIAACHDADNPKSGRVMDKVGMKQEGILRQEGINNQGICDIVWHGVLRKEFRTW